MVDRFSYLHDTYVFLANWTVSLKYKEKIL
jgi:hypothetical protein